MAEPATASDRLDALAALVGPAHARAATAADAIDDVRPAAVAAPETAASLAAVLAWASAERVATVVAGSGTRRCWGRTPAPFDLILGTRGLSRVLHHEPGDLTVSAEAGVTLASLNRSLAAHGQWLPLDAPFDASTIGGTLATNDSGPHRQRHGAPRDLLIGIQIATADGRLVKAGGNVVKNVAGYDLGRLMCGSFGTLAVIVSATFKLAPLPAATSTLVANFGQAEALADAAGAVAGSQLDPACLDVRVTVPTAARLIGAHRLLVRFAGPAAANNAQVAAARLLIAASRPAALDVAMGDDEARLWHDQMPGLWEAGGTLIRLSWLPAALPAVAGLLETLARDRTLALTLAARAALGTGLIRLEGDANAQADLVRQLRTRSDLLSHVVLARAERALKTTLDVWGPAGDTRPLLTRIKQRLDPMGILGAGRGMI
jgi:glycolate oxidase FAD binding subunit